jgi:hypothetical protein
MMFDVADEGVSSREECMQGKRDPLAPTPDQLMWLDRLIQRAIVASFPSFRGL